MALHVYCLLLWCVVSLDYYHQLVMGYNIQEKKSELSFACIKIVPKSEWDGEPAIKLIYTPTPVKYVIIHHTATSECHDQLNCARLVRSMQNFQMTQNMFYDIGYNFLLGGDGKIYEGSGWHKTGAPSIPFNNRSLVIGFIGDFSNVLPNQKQFTAAKDLLRCGIEMKEIHNNYRLLGARQVRHTLSPGDMLYRELQTWCHYSRLP